MKLNKYFEGYSHSLPDNNAFQMTFPSRNISIKKDNIKYKKIASVLSVFETLFTIEIDNVKYDFKNRKLHISEKLFIEGIFGDICKSGCEF